VLLSSQMQQMVTAAFKREGGHVGYAEVLPWARIEAWRRQPAQWQQLYPQQILPTKVCEARYAKSV